MRLVVLALLVLASLAAASPAPLAGGRADALRLVADQPLGVVLRQIGQRWPGRALAAHVAEHDGRPLYRIKWLGADGKVRDITADARTGEILAVR